MIVSFIGGSKKISRLREKYTETLSIAQLRADVLLEVTDCSPPLRIGG